MTDRSALLARLNDLVRTHAVELAGLVRAEMGSPPSLALAEQVGSPIAIIDDCVSLLGEETPETWVGRPFLEPV